MKTRCCCSKRYLLVFSILLVSVGSIFMSVSLSSCSSPSVKNQLLLCADSLMETYPDSALSILESITYPQKMPRADRALYALLLTQARHKSKRLRDSILSPFFHSYIFAMYKNEALWI